MNLEILTGASTVVAAGILQGLFAVPMKYARCWNYENIWLVFALTGLVIFPAGLTMATVPHLAEVYRQAPVASIAAVVGFGFCWGGGAAMTGLGLSMLGIGLGLAVILGITASVGSLVPLLARSPEKLGTSQGRLYLLGTVVMLIGIGVAARAGSLRDQAKAGDRSEGVTVQGSFLAGLLVAISAGLLSSALNFCYAFGGELITTARSLGASPVWATNVVAAPATVGGFVMNFLYCAYLLRKNATAGRFRIRALSINWLHGTLMGAFWFGGLAVYGLGVSRMGAFGTVIGWPLLMGTIIITSNVAGFLTGEWKGAGGGIHAWLGAGMAIILSALWILSLAQRS